MISLTEFGYSIIQDDYNTVILLKNEKLIYLKQFNNELSHKELFKLIVDYLVG